jgi:bifunctional UDP-N-acetylglucosamine pyrophosphorylase/glucosamine-1-phosphate N-acetyltransferase
MQTVVLAAGEGTRMRPLTETRPKPTLPVAGRPLVEHTVSAAVAAGAERVIVVVAGESGPIRASLGDRVEGVPVEYAVQADQRGTADAVRAAADRLSDGPFAVLNGDSLYDVPSLSDLYDATPAVGSFRVDDPSQYGVLEVADAGDEPGGDGPRRVTGVIEKPADPPSNLVNAGAYAFPAAARDWLAVSESERGELELTDVLSRACVEYEVRTVPFERWLDVGRPWDLLAANEWKLAEVSAGVADGADVHPDAELTGTVRVEAGATVRAGVVIDGPALVSEGATVGPNAFVRGATLVGPDAKVGHAVEVKNAVLFEGATVGHLSYVGDSVLGRDVNFGAGTNVANLRHDGADVRMTLKGDRVSTGRRKLGVVCGDEVKTGINTSLNAGVVLAGGARTGPGEVVTRDVRPDG